MRAAVSGELMDVEEVAIGQTVPGTDYVVVEAIGEGGQGVVYKVRDPFLENDFVMKLLDPGLARDEDAVLRFKREAMSLSRLRHPNVVHVIKGGITAEPERRPFYVMEYHVGMALSKVLQERRDAGDIQEQKRRALIEQGILLDDGRPAPKGALSLEKSLIYAAQVLEGLHEAHTAHKIIHRDIKPHNILVVHVTSMESKALVIDFGIAKLLNASHRATAAGHFIGTYEYAAPEQHGGKVGPETDIYAVALVLFESLVGEHIFEHVRHRARAQGSRRAYAEAHLTEVPRRLRDLFNVDEHSAYGELDRLVARMLEKNPSKRPNSALDVAKSLRQMRQELSKHFDALLAQAPHGVPNTIDEPVNRMLAREYELFEYGGTIGSAPQRPTPSGMGIGRTTAHLLAVVNADAKVQVELADLVIPSVPISVHYTPESGPPNSSVGDPHAVRAGVAAPSGIALPLGLAQTERVTKDTLRLPSAPPPPPSDDSGNAVRVLNPYMPALTPRAHSGSAAAPTDPVAVHSAASPSALHEAPRDVRVAPTAAIAPDPPRQKPAGSTEPVPAEAVPVSEVVGVEQVAQFVGSSANAPPRTAGLHLGLGDNVHAAPMTAAGSTSPAAATPAGSFSAAQAQVVPAGLADVRPSWAAQPAANGAASVQNAPMGLAARVALLLLLLGLVGSVAFVVGRRKGAQSSVIPVAASAMVSAVASTGPTDTAEHEHDAPVMPAASATAAASPAAASAAPALSKKPPATPSPSAVNVAVNVAANAAAKPAHTVTAAPVAVKPASASILPVKPGVAKPKGSAPGLDF